MQKIKRLIVKIRDKVRLFTKKGLIATLVLKIRDKVRLFTKDELRTVLVLGVTLLIFSIPLKYLCGLTGAPYLFLLVLSGLITYVKSKMRQVLQDKHKDPTMSEFLRIFFTSMCFIFIFGMIGYPLMGFICGEVLGPTLEKTLENLLSKCKSSKSVDMMGNGLPGQIIDRKGKGKEVLPHDSTLNAHTRNRDVEASNVPSQIIPGLNLDLKYANFGSLWPERIRFVCVHCAGERCTHCAWDWISNEVIPYRKQSYYQLQNIILHLRDGINDMTTPEMSIDKGSLSELDRKIALLGASAEYQSRVFFNTYTGDDPEILAKKGEVSKLGRTWSSLYRKIGRKSVYRANWEHELRRTTGNWYEFEDSFGGVESFPHLSARGLSHKNVMDDKALSSKVALERASNPNNERSILSLLEIKSAWYSEKEISLQGEVEAGKNENREASSQNVKRGKKRALEGESSSQNANRGTKRRK